MPEENDQRKLQSLLIQIQSYQSTLQAVSRQTALIERSLEDVYMTLQALEELPKTKESESLVPIGAGVYVKADITDKKKALVSVGDGVFIDKTMAEAKAYLKERQAEMEKNEKLLRERGQKISEELNAANQSAEELYAKLQSGQ